MPPETVNKRAIHPRIGELLELLDETRASLMMAVARVPEEARDRRAGEGRWTVGEVLDHLHRVDAGFARRIQKVVAEAGERGTPRETETSSVLGRLERSAVTDRSRRLEAPEVVRPAQAARASEALAALKESRAAVRDGLIAASGLALGTIVFPHVMFGQLDMYQWTLFLGWHEVRHAEQIREIAEAMRA
ncbi:MAG TPA: DinB family protein [Gemmatimonadaceae bacterium]